MPNYIRWREAGATYFFTIVTLRRMPIFEQEFAREAFRTAIQLTQKTHPFEMPACVLLPDHFHCPWTMPRGDSDFPIRWRMIKSRFTRTYLHAGGEEQRTTRNAADEGRRGVLQPRYFEHRIRDERDYTVHRDYIHFNPVKHGLVATPEDWPHSTVHVHFQRGELAPDWWNGVELVLPYPLMPKRGVRHGRRFVNHIHSFIHSFIHSCIHSLIQPPFPVDFHRFLPPHSPGCVS